MRYRASVVVPTYKRPDRLRCCIEALLNQNCEPCTYEIVIVDDAACPDLCRLVNSWARDAAQTGHMLRYLPAQGSHGPAAVRNIGWQAAQGEIIAFTDDDCLPHPDWLKMGLAAFRGDVVGASGRIVVPVHGVLTDYEQNAAHLATAEFVTANCFYCREVLAQAGGFDERFTTAWREDSDLFFRLLKSGQGWLVTVPEAVVVHPVRPAAWGISVKQQRKSMFNALLYKKHPRLYRQRIQASPPLHYYGIVGAGLLTLWGLGEHSPRKAGLGFGLWLWLMVRFCTSRLRRTSRTPEHIAEMVLTSLVIPPLAVFWRLFGAFKFRVWFF